MKANDFVRRWTELKKEVEKQVCEGEWKITSKKLRRYMWRECEIRLQRDEEKKYVEKIEERDEKIFVEKREEEIYKPKYSCLLDSILPTVEIKKWLSGPIFS